MAEQGIVTLCIILPCDGLIQRSRDELRTKILPRDRISGLIEALVWDDTTQDRTELHFAGGPS